MFFEGSEKKVEIVAHGAGLRGFGEAFWSDLVERARARVLSKIYTDQVDSYLLSESSLFVWDDRFTLITCGRTTLVDAVVEFAKKVPVDRWDLFIFELKNEYRPQLQLSSFDDDVKRLKSHLSGRPYRFGAIDAHHLFLFHSEKPYRPHSEDRTLEILMYDLQGDAKDLFGKPPRDKLELRRRAGLDKVFDGFAIDDFLFDPCGYSLNAIRGDFYFTVHVTPEENGSYVSFETNLVGSTDTDGIVERVTAIFQPRSFDVIGFNCAPASRVGDFQARSWVEKKLDCGYEVRFQHFEAPWSQKTEPYLIQELR
jgi:S-adenosylmethionine decarboxylase